MSQHELTHAEWKLVAKLLFTHGTTEAFVTYRRLVREDLTLASCAPAPITEYETASVSRIDSDFDDDEEDMDDWDGPDDDDDFDEDDF